ncbi:protein FAR1-RELATED SEQUENCE 5-like [Bidens hawaiensis]|uniref:protein FAR1-RELATED SEQUENCE 5-like n=1 Tax=Bidens hawaiensis TaxID=980011 RepID=UPI00404A3585
MLIEELDSSGSIVAINGALSVQLNDSMSNTFVTATNGDDYAEITDSVSESRVNQSSISYSVSSCDSASSYCVQTENNMQSVGVEHRGRVSSIVYHTPNGTTYWKPNVPDEFVPVKDMEFETWDDSVNMYNTYADKSGFSIRLSTIKRVKGSVTHRYMLYTRAGKPKFQDFDSSISNSASTPRRSSFKAVCCNARLILKPVPNTMRFKIYDFDDIHTHELIGPNTMEFTKKRRKIGYSERNFIHKLSLNKIGPNIAHNLQCSLKGGSQNVNGTKTDFQNATRDVRLFISDRDAQMIVDTMTSRSVNLPNFSFEYKVVGSEIRYGMIFVPFTGVDHHKKCVTFGVGLIYDETIESYKWLLDKFLKTHKKQPKLVLTDQDAAVNKLEIQWCCLMKTTSRCESSNSLFKVNTSHANTLVQFLLYFGTALDRQQKTQLELDIESSTTTPKMPEKLPLEIHPSKIYTRKIFLEVQKEIYRGMRQCYVTSSSELDGIKKFNIAHTNKRFKVVNNYVVELIPDKYLPARWMRNVLPERVHDISNRYSAEDDEESVIRRNMFELLTECADQLIHKPDCVNSLLVQLKDIKDKVFKEFPSEPPCNSKRSIICELVGQPDTINVTIKPPTGIRNKGSGTKHQVGIVEKLLENCNKNPRLCHKCNKYVIDHDSRNCEKVKDAKEAAAAAAAVLADAVVAKSIADSSVNRCVYAL